jgi:FMN phosphatase YigB (HAD superfamily)
LVVGDNLKREITAGNKIGAFIVWTRQNLSDDWKPQNELQVPKATIEAIEELVPLIKGLNNFI